MSGDEKDEIIPHLQEINNFIHCYRNQSKNVLVFSETGRNRGPAIVAQYLIQVNFL